MNSKLVVSCHLDAGRGDVGTNIIHCTPGNVIHFILEKEKDMYRNQTIT
jgi:hypothetical protein